MNAITEPAPSTATWTWTAVYKSNTVRALATALIAWTLNVAGVDAAIGHASAAQVVDLGLTVIQGGAMLWALYARTRQPTPPLTLTMKSAEEKNAAHIPAPSMTT